MIDGLDPNSSYTYRVRGVDMFGVFDSNTVDSQRQPPNTAPQTDQQLQSPAMFTKPRALQPLTSTMLVSAMTLISMVTLWPTLVSMILLSMALWLR